MEDGKHEARLQLENSSEERIALLYFTGADTYNKIDLLKYLGFGFGVTHFDKILYNTPKSTITDNNICNSH